MATCTCRRQRCLPCHLADILFDKCAMVFDYTSWRINEKAFLNYDSHWFPLLSINYRKALMLTIKIIFGAYFIISLGAQSTIAGKQPVRSIVSIMYDPRIPIHPRPL